MSIISNTILTFGKLAVGISMNSVSVISEAVHSGMDLVAALIAFFSVRESSKPADERHHYGHGKFENLAGILEALLILAAAVMIIINAWTKLRGGMEIHSLGLGAAVMVLSALVNFFVSRELMRVARETDSPALAADSWHLRTDVYTSLGVLAGIAAIKATGLAVLDPLIAMGVAVLILKAGIDLIRDSMRSMLDVRLPVTEEKEIREVLKKYSGQFVEFHKLRTRKAGSQRYIDLHLVVPREWAIKKVHSLCDQIEEDIGRRFADSHVLIHTEPCGQCCEECSKAEGDNRAGTGCGSS
ncbi:predicted Co/Zn/Cd cation transporters [Pelotomaculum thermopropionicum SI]|uniref:Predicted Co/Zn/Cd cation transporters n=1 Tax=Pelotomaculum thermopropionicum (strain DSM 13744 / JCM 10971 / SI) TaxID=370438 RepID=A5D3H5_PELTS|nr:predicted Co/Zn/Cd cation transporters [Pelotomaculum thermopropionicum SI]